MIYYNSNIKHSVAAKHYWCLGGTERTFFPNQLAWSVPSKADYKAASSLKDYRSRIQPKICGFTLIEILIVVVIIAIAAMIVVPMMSSAASLQIRAAANMVAADLEYAKSMAISRGQYYSVVFDKDAETYEVRDQSCSVIQHPVKKGFNYIVDFQNDSRLDRVGIVDADFDSDPSQTITFDYLGNPYSGSGAGISNLLNKGVISLQADSITKTVIVEPVTGYISISD
jgi:prepilin-type N-terminal cleavage/methylation domain-containing protein